MSVIILFNGHDEVMRPQTATVPWPLLEVAGGTLASYSILFLREVLTGPVIVVLSAGNRAVAPYLQATYPDIDFTFVQLEIPASDILALRRCRDLVSEREPLYLIDGGAIYRADFSALAGPGDGALLTQSAQRGPGHFGLSLGSEGEVALLQPEADAEWVAVGAFWLRESRHLFAAVDHVLAAAPEPTYYALWRRLHDQGLRLYSAEAAEWEKGLTQEALLRMNSRLLANNFGRSNALERSFGEGFTVLTPVYLADSAEVDGAVLGPYVAIGENAVIKDAVISNSIVAAGAHVEAVTLTNSLIGPGARLTGRRHTLFVGQDEQIDFDGNGG